MATYEINKITLPNGDVCNLSGSGTDVQINGTSITSGGVANIPYASTSAAGVVSTGAQTMSGEKTFVATNGYGGSIIIDSNRIESGGQLTLKHRHADDEDPSVIGDTEVYTFKSNGDWGLEIDCSNVPSSGSGFGGTYTLEIPNGDYYLAYKNTTTSSSTTPVYFSGSDGVLTACSGVVVTTGTQTFSGAKSFSDNLSVGDSALTAERYIRSWSNSGTIYLNSVGNANGDGNRGVYVGAHGTATGGKYLLRADTNNNVFIADGTTCEGTLSVTGGLRTINTTGNSASAPVFIFSNAPTANAEYGRMFLSYSNYGGRFKFRQYSGSSTARTSYNETYLLPQTDASRTASAEYNIITTKNISDIPDASLTVAGKVTTDTQKFGGQKVFDKILSINYSSGTGYPMLYFRDEVHHPVDEVGGYTSAAIFNATMDITQNRLGFALWSPKSDGTGYTTKSESFTFPAVDVGRTTNGAYRILTTKGTQTYTASLTTAGWSSLTQSVTVTGMTADAIIMVSADPASEATYRHSGVYCSAQAANSLTFTCASTPTAAITVNILTIG